jgi:hypothetical protein
MQITLNIKNESISKKILDFLSSFQKDDVQIETIEKEKKESLSSFVGIWKDRDIDLNTIREAAWKRYS